MQKPSRRRVCFAMPCPFPPPGAHPPSSSASLRCSCWLRAVRGRRVVPVLRRRSRRPASRFAQRAAPNLRGPSKPRAARASTSGAWRAGTSSAPRRRPRRARCALRRDRRWRGPSCSTSTASARVPSSTRRPRVSGPSGRGTASMWPSRTARDPSAVGHGRRACDQSRSRVRASPARPDRIDHVHRHLTGLRQRLLGRLVHGVAPRLHHVPSHHRHRAVSGLQLPTPCPTTRRVPVITFHGRRPDRVLQRGIGTATLGRLFGQSPATTARRPQPPPPWPTSMVRASRRPSAAGRRRTVATGGPPTRGWTARSSSAPTGARRVQAWCSTSSSAGATHGLAVPSAGRSAPSPASPPSRWTPPRPCGRSSSASRSERAQETSPAVVTFSPSAARER